MNKVIFNFICIFFFSVDLDVLYAFILFLLIMLVYGEVTLMPIGTHHGDTHKQIHCFSTLLSFLQLFFFLPKKK